GRGWTGSRGGSVGCGAVRRHAPMVLPRGRPGARITRNGRCGRNPGMASSSARTQSPRPGGSLMADETTPETTAPAEAAPAGETNTVPDAVIGLVTDGAYTLIIAQFKN